MGTEWRIPTIQRMVLTRLIPGITMYKDTLIKIMGLKDGNKAGTNRVGTGKDGTDKAGVDRTQMDRAGTDKLQTNKV